MAWYKDWFGTHYYKLLYGHRDEEDARPWVRTILERSKLPSGSAVLDIACGRGRHARCFVDAGMQVTGIDLSEESIQEARALVPQAEFHVHDMRESFATDRFDLVVCLFTSLGYSEDGQDDTRTLAAASAALKPGGLLVLDVLNPPVVAGNLVPKEVRMLDGVRFEIDRRYENGFFVKEIGVTDGAIRKCYTEKVRGHDPVALSAMVERTGLRVTDLTMGPEPAEFDPKSSPRCVIWAERPRQ